MIFLCLFSSVFSSAFSRFSFNFLLNVLMLFCVLARASQCTLVGDLCLRHSRDVQVG
jgi:hypothetical protein